MLTTELSLKGNTSFLDELNYSELKDIAKQLKKDGLLKVDYTRMKRINLIEAIMKATPPKEDEPLIDEKKKEIKEMNYNIYEVRYVGYGGNSIQNYNSNPSGKQYTFPNGDWIRVDKVDFENKYLKKVEKSIEADIDPHWQVRRKTQLGQILNYFAEKINIIKSRKPKKLIDLRHMTDVRMNELRRINIRSFSDFVSLPNEVIIQRLRLSKVQAQEMIDHARRAIQ